MSSRGWDVSGLSDQFTFLSTPASGDVTLIAKVASLLNTDPWALGGLMIRQSLRPDAGHVSLFVTPGRSLVVRSRATTGGGTVQLTLGEAAAPVWLRLDRRSGSVTAYASADGVTWKSVATLTFTLNQSALAGLALASHSTLNAVAASFTNFSLNGAVIPPLTVPVTNSPPSVSMNSPSTGSAFGAPATIAMGATAVDRDGSIARVDFYAGSTRIGADTTSPYTFSWGNVAPGSYALKAVASDNVGGTATSSSVTVTVVANKPPIVSLTSPLSGATFTAPATIALAALASDPDGTIQKVEFYRGATLIGSDTTSPYTFSWQSVPAGSYSLRAVARDNLGASTVSASSSITVAATLLSKALFAPAIVSGPIDHYLFEVFRAGSDPSVATPVGSQNLGVPPLVNGEIVADVRATITGLASGSYIATVSSISAVEGKLRSAPFAFSR
jgi:regulation of enolase protein 1 (concanavalin A-like superfamily)